MKKKICLIVIAVLVSLTFWGCNRLSKNQGKNSEICSVPVIKSIVLLDQKGNILNKGSAWVKLSPQTTIRVSYQGEATQVDFYTIPTGTQTYLLQQCIGSIVCTKKETNAELIWNVPNDFMGYIFVLVYNKDVARRSDEFFIVATAH